MQIKGFRYFEEEYDELGFKVEEIDEGSIPLEAVENKTAWWINVNPGHPSAEEAARLKFERNPEIQYIEAAVRGENGFIDHNRYFKRVNEDEKDT